MTKEAEYYVDNCINPPQSFFDWCESQIPIYKWKNKKKEILSSDREFGFSVEKRLTKVSNLDFNGGFYAFVIIMVDNNKIEIQTYGYHLEIIQGRESLHVQLINIEVLSNNECVEVGFYWYRDSYGFGLVSIGVQGGKYTGAEEYENDWQDKIKTVSELKYLDFSFTEEIYFRDLAHYYKNKNEIEYLQKINAKRIASEVATNARVDYRTFNQRWLRKNKQLLKNNPDDFFTFELKRRIRDRGGKVVPGIEEYLTYRDLSYISNKVGIISFQNWVIKNKVNMVYYRDYLGLLKDLNIKLDSRNLIMPKDLAVAHDNAVGLLNELQREIDNKKMVKRIKALKKLEKTIGDYCFVAPTNLNDLVTEGKQLHHCVGSSTYIERHRNGQTTIIFVRHKDLPNTPFYTMEFRDGQIRQLRGKHNKDADESVQQAADKWLQVVTGKVS